jgi:hypothetical protein
VREEVALRRRRLHRLLLRLCELSNDLLSFYRVANGPEEELPIDRPFDNVILGPRVHRAQRDTLVVQSGKHDDRYLGDRSMHCAECVQPSSVRK